MFLLLSLLMFGGNSNQNSTRTKNVGSGNNNGRQMVGNWSEIIGTQLGDINAREETERALSNGEQAVKWTIY